GVVIQQRRSSLGADAGVVCSAWLSLGGRRNDSCRCDRAARTPRWYLRGSAPSRDLGIRQIAVVVDRSVPEAAVSGADQAPNRIVVAERSRGHELAQADLLIVLRHLEV